MTNNQFLFAYRIEDLDIYKTRCSDIPNIEEKEKYYNISLKNWYCINFDSQTLGGFWDGEFVNNYSIIVEQCLNSTDKNYTCQSHVSNYENKSLFFFSYLYMESMPTMDNFNYPIKSTLINRYDMIDFKVIKKHVHTFKESSINDDRGWIFSDLELKSIYASDNIFSDFAIKDETTRDPTLFIYYMYFGKRYEIYNRTYMKVQEVIGSIGGFSRFFHLIVYIFYKNLSNIIKNLDLMETTYNNFIETSIIGNIENNRAFNNYSNIDMKNTIKCNFNNYVKIKNNKKDMDLNLIIKNKIFCKSLSRISTKQKMNIIEYDAINKYHNHNLMLLII